MKKTIHHTILIITAVSAAMGIILCAAGLSIGGSFWRVLKNNDMLPEIIYSNDKPQNPYQNRNGNRNSGSSMDDFSDFFREFGLDDDDINSFFAPYGGSSGGSGNSESGNGSGGALF